MPYREIIDDGGIWIVFGTQPRSGANVRPQYAGGWLSFHRGAERRRLSPIPSGWEAAGDDQLRLWLRTSEVVAKAIEDDEALRSGTAAESGTADGTAAAGAGALAVPWAAEPGPAVAEAAEPGPAVAEAAEPGPAVAKAAAPVPHLQESVARIREMLSSIRGDIA